jgi:DNA-binding winged helix-turn-helix (wHTH) protein
MVTSPREPSTPREIRRFGPFELDIDAVELRREGRRVKLQPQPFKLLLLLTSRPGSLITREQIRTDLWPEGTFVAFDQAVNFAIKQIRDALGDSADRPVYLETVPRQGYRFVAPVDRGGTPVTAPPVTPPPVAPPPGGTTVRLQKAMWANIAELRLAQARQRRLMRLAIAGMLLAIIALVVYVLLK